jgi:hypothetical protein
MEVPKGWRGRTTFYKVCQKASEDAQPFTKYGSSFRLVRTDSLGQSMEIKLGWRGRTTLDKVKHTEMCIVGCHGQKEIVQKYLDIFK